MGVPVRYKDQEIIDSGGFGSVYKMYDTSLERYVAVKSVKRSAASHLVDGEIDMIKRIDSKYVVSIYDYISDADNYYLIQEYLSGNSLISVVGKITTEQFITFGYQISKGLADIHSFGICHRDIKPQNIRFDAYGLLKIFDFGISRDGDDHHTVNGNATLQYAGPEFFEAIGNNGIELSQATDIFALGASLWHLFFGGVGKFNKHIHGNRIIPDFTMTGVYSFLKSILDATLAENPVDRPTSVQVYEAFKSALLFDKHIGQFVVGSKEFILNSQNRKISLNANNSSISVEYDGISFMVSAISGKVTQSNMPVIVGQPLPSACVLTIEDPANNKRRSFISFSSSSPEVVF